MTQILIDPCTFLFFTCSSFIALFLKLNDKSKFIKIIGMIITYPLHKYQKHFNSTRAKNFDSKKHFTYSFEFVFGFVYLYHSIIFYVPSKLQEFFGKTNTSKEYLLPRLRKTYGYQNPPNIIDTIHKEHDSIYQFWASYFYRLYIQSIPIHQARQTHHHLHPGRLNNSNHNIDSFYTIYNIVHRKQLLRLL